MIPRFLVALAIRTIRVFRALSSRRARAAGRSDDGPGEAGVPAKLKVPPPILSAAAARALPYPDDATAA